MRQFALHRKTLNNKVPKGLLDFLVLLSASPAMRRREYNLCWHTIDGGGGTSGGINLLGLSRSVQSVP